MTSFATLLGLVDLFTHYISDALIKWLCGNAQDHPLNQVAACSANVDIQLLILLLLLLLLGSVLITWSAISEPNIDW